MIFEWDPAKAASNLKHGISFDEAEEAFQDPLNARDGVVIESSNNYRGGKNCRYSINTNARVMP